MSHKRRALRFRIWVAFAAFSLCVACLFAATAHILLHEAEDRVIRRQLAREIDRLVRYFPRVRELPPSSPQFAAYLEADLPAELADEARALPRGTHEMDAVGRERVISRATLDGTSDVFVVYDVPEDEFLAWQPVIGLAALAIAGTGMLLGFVTARRMARPLTALAATVEETLPAELAGVLAEGEHDHEIQVLVDRLRNSLDALDAYSIREQHFTRYASHELRTPVAVIKGAIELLAAAPEAGERRVRRPLERIMRAAGDMEAIIDAFLWLARERQADESSPVEPLLPIVERVLDRHRHLVVGRQVEVRVDLPVAPTVAAPTTILEVVIGNLVANAFHFTERGAVTVATDRSSLTVSDTGPGMVDVEQLGQPFARGPDSAGYGLGLSIVRALCNRFNWTLAIDSAPGVGTRATVSFDPLISQSPATSTASRTGHPRSRPGTGSP